MFRPLTTELMMAIRTICRVQYPPIPTHGASTTRATTTSQIRPGRAGGSRYAGPRRTVPADRTGRHRRCVSPPPATPAWARPERTSPAEPDSEPLDMTLRYLAENAVRSGQQYQQETQEHEDVSERRVQVLSRERIRQPGHEAPDHAPELVT